MKAEELMIGDWVEYGGYITTVRNLSDKIVLSGCIGRLDEVRPVKITTKIFEKNGFLRHGKEYCNLQQWILKIGDKKYLSIQQDTQKEEFCVETIWINYVHEMQHILKLCKINAEIKL